MDGASSLARLKRSSKAVVFHLTLLSVSEREPRPDSLAAFAQSPVHSPPPSKFAPFLCLVDRETGSICLGRMQLGPCVVPLWHGGIVERARGARRLVPPPELVPKDSARCLLVFPWRIVASEGHA